jgi:hypothetical protein
MIRVKTVPSGGSRELSRLSSALSHLLNPGRSCPVSSDHSSSHTHSLSFFFLKENVSLIKEINELRRELKFTRSQVYDLESALKLSKKIRPQEAPETGNVSGGQGDGHWDLRTNGQALASSCVRSYLSMAFWEPLYAMCLLSKRFVRTFPYSDTHRSTVPCLKSLGLATIQNSEPQILERAFYLLCNIPRRAGAVP